MVEPEDYSTAVAELMKLFSGERVPPHTFRMIKKNKDIIWVEVFGQPVFSETGELLGTRTSTRDITQLKESEEKFSAAFNKSPEAKLITRVSDGKIINVNEMFCEYSGFSYEEAINKTVLELNLLTDSKLRNNIITALESGSAVKNLEIQFRNRNHEIKSALLSAGLINTNNESLILTSLIDISQ
jgi:PAS domain S-box-containing protein